MLLKRIIPCLLLENQRLVKTEKFLNPIYVGDPINAVKIFSEKEADEIIIIDIGASKKKFIDFKLLSNIFNQCFVPITYGGGITTLEDAKKIFNLGAEKISLQSTFFDNKDLIKSLVKYFGSQIIILSIDIKKNLFGKYKIWNYRKNNFYKKETIKKILYEIQELGIGELMITDVDNEGTMSGTNKSLIIEISKDINIPLIFNGGISSIDDMKESFESGTDGIAVGSFFVFYGKHKAVLITYPTDQIKSLINE